jgi:hypothetical protein
MDLNINAEEHFKQVEEKKSNGNVSNVMLNGNSKANGHDNQNNSNEVLFVTSDFYDYSQFGFTLNEVYSFARLFVKGISIELQFKSINYLNLDFY